MTAPSDLHGLIERLRHFSGLGGRLGLLVDEAADALERLSAHTDTGGEMVLVPREPTEAMVEAGWRAKGSNHEGRPVWKCSVDVQARATWSAMLAAAPATADTGDVERMREALIAIRKVMKPQPSALAVAIIATIDDALRSTPQQGEQ